MFKHIISLKLIIVLFLTTQWLEVTAQNVIGYGSISTAEGLSQGMVFDMLQDKEGFIWVATKNGLNRYDGYSFKIFTNDPYNSNSLSSNTILKLLEDSKGRIWAGTENAGVNIYDKKSGKFYRIAHSILNPASLSGNGIRSILEMKDGRMLVATNSDGLNIIELNNNFFANGAAPLITRVNLPNAAQVYGMGKDKSGITWIGGMDGLVYRFDYQKNSFTKLIDAALLNDGYMNPDSSKLINSNFYLLHGKEIFPLFNGSTNPAGNIIFKPRDKLWDNYHREDSFYDAYKYIPGKIINWNAPLPKNTTRLCYPFIIDRSGLLWSGSVGYGLRKYNVTRNQFKTVVSGKTIRLIIPAAGNSTYIVSYDYHWMNLNENGHTTDVFKEYPSLTQIDNFIIASTGDYWFKCDEKGYFKFNPVSKSLQEWPKINANQSFGNKQPFIEDRKANLWFPGQDGVITLLNTVTEKLDSFNINKDASKIICTALYEDKQGTFWIGTEKGFAKTIINNKRIAASQIKWFYNSSSNRNSLNYNHVSCFLDDPSAPDKYLWISTKGGGLNRLDKTTGNFLHLTSKDGLPDDVVYGILADDAGNIWGSSNKGIFCLKATKNNDWVFYNFTKANGLQDDEFNTGCYAKLSNGNLAFGGVKGVNIFNPKEILVDGFMPNVFITSILINNQFIAPGDNTAVLQNTIEQSKNITLSHLQDILTLEFSSLDLTAPAQNKYRYQLVGVDRDWVESGTRRTATYLHLPSGKYNFRVQGSNSQGIWSDKIATLQITVLPPWWLSWWAYVVYATLLFFGIRTYFKFSVNRAKLKAQLNFEQLEAKRIKELDSIKTQLYTNITHEFRTPLTIILGMAQQVKSNPPLHLNSGIDMILRNGQSLLNLVNEMLDLSKLESGKMQLQLVNGDVIHFLRYIIESFHSLAESQKKQLHFLAEMDALYISYDPEKIRQIISNLLSNALKFTPERGNIYIGISQNILEDNEHIFTLIIKVRDTGIGIPENQLEHIFDRFYQLDNSHTRKSEGTGIGLALTKELVKLMDGEITVKSPPTGATKGTEFTITLPFKKITTAEKQIIYREKKDERSQKLSMAVANGIITDEDTKDAKKPLILLVEDNADVVAYTASCLPDYRLAIGQDGREGFRIATEIIPDLIITDVMMPFVDGFELCRQLRHDKHTSHIPIIMLTAKADVESKIEGLENGADAYIQKPFHREELLTRIKKLLELRKNLQQFYLQKAGLNTNSILIKTGLAVEEPTRENKIEDDFVKKIREVIEKNITDTNFTVEQLCKQVFMSHSQLHRKLDALTGCSPSKFIRIIRLNKAKKMLKNSTISIAAISLECGYNDPGYFARVFKQDYVVTPQEWRTNNWVLQDDDKTV